MTLDASLAWTLLRAVALLMVCLPLCSPLADWVRHSPRRWAVLAAPFVFPELLAGYAYAPWVAGRPWIAEACCALLLGLRTLPVAVLAWELAPPGPATRSALYCQRLTICSWRDGWDFLRLWLAGPWRKALPAAGLFLLVTFQEFELAAIVRAVSWTDWLFVAQIQGMTLASSLRAASLPACVELLVLTAVLWPLRRSLATTEPTDAPQTSHTTWVLPTVAAAWLLVIVVPLLPLMTGLPAGIGQLAAQRVRWQGLWKELAVGLSASVCAATAAWFLAGWLLRAWTFRRRRPWGLEDSSPATRIRPDPFPQRSGTTLVMPLLLAVCLPGLLGSLILSLMLLALFQRDSLAFLYDTPLPWLLGLMLFLLPRAVLLQAWSGLLPRSTWHLAELLRRSTAHGQQRLGVQLQWEAHGEGRFFVIALLTYWGYLELTLAYLLAPTGLTSGVVRLYNFMHFGRTAALTAEAAVLLLLPLLGTWCLWMLLRWRVRRTTFSGDSAA